MNWRTTLCVLVLSVCTLAPTNAFGKAKQYQVTGPILSIEDKVVTIEKGEEKWQIELTEDTKMDGKLAVGEKVTIYYRMVADKVEKKSESAKN